VRTVEDAALVQYAEARVLSINGRSDQAALSLREGRIRAGGARARLAKRLDAARGSAEAVLKAPAAELGSRPFENPYYWAAFSVVGDWA
jgi:CHAT domain-containing protein